LRPQSKEMPREEKHIRLSQSGSTRSSACFKLKLSETQILKLGNIGFRETLISGRQLVSIESRTNSVFILNEGSAEILVPDINSNLQAVRQVASGEMLGLTESLAGAERDFCVRSISECVFTEISREELVKFLQQEPDMCFELASMMAAAFIECLHAAIEIN